MNGKPILTVCAGTKDEDGVHQCSMVKPDNVWIDDETFSLTYGRLIMSEYSLSHGLCPHCFKITKENYTKQQGK